MACCLTGETQQCCPHGCVLCHSPISVWGGRCTCCLCRTAVHCLSCSPAQGLVVAAHVCTLLPAQQRFPVPHPHSCLYIPSWAFCRLQALTLLLLPCPRL